MDGGGLTGSPSWPPSWFLPIIRNRVKTARIDTFFVLDM